MDVRRLLREWQEHHEAEPLGELLVLGHTVDRALLEAGAIPLAHELGARVAVLEDSGGTPPNPAGTAGSGLGPLYGAADCPGGFHPELVLLLGEDSCRIAIGPRAAPGSGAGRGSWTVIATDGGDSHPLVADLADWLEALPETVVLTPWWAGHLRHLAELLVELHCAAPPSEPSESDARLVHHRPGADSDRGCELGVTGAGAPADDAAAPGPATNPPAPSATADVDTSNETRRTSTPVQRPGVATAGIDTSNGHAFSPNSHAAQAAHGTSNGSVHTGGTGPDTDAATTGIDTSNNSTHIVAVAPQDPPVRADAPPLRLPTVQEAAGALSDDPAVADRFAEDLGHLWELLLPDTGAAAPGGPAALPDDAREQARTRTGRLVRQLSSAGDPAVTADGRALPATLLVAVLHLRLLAAGAWDEDDYGWRPVTADLIHALAGPAPDAEPDLPENQRHRLDAVIAVLMSLLGLHGEIEGADADPTAAAAWRRSRSAVGRARPEHAADLYLPAGRRGAPVATGADIEALGKRARAVPDPVAEARRALAAAGLAATHEAGVWELTGVFNNPQAACAKAVTLLAALPDGGWPGPALARATGPRFPCFMAWHRPVLVRQVGRQWTSFRIPAPGTPLAAFQSGAPRPAGRDDQARRELGPLLEAAGVDLLELFLHLSGASGLPD